jgi:hypothetical protein
MMKYRPAGKTKNSYTFHSSETPNELETLQSGPSSKKGLLTCAVFLIFQFS